MLVNLQNAIMKKYLSLLPLLALLLSTSCGSIGQYLDFSINENKFVYQERRQPEKQLNPAFFYYNTQFSVPRTYEDIIGMDGLVSNVYIEGQRYTDNPKNGDIIVSVMYNPISMGDVTIHEDYLEMKNEKGKTVKVLSFWVECLYGMNVDATLSRGGQIIDNYVLARASSPQVYASKPFRDRREAQEYWKLNKDFIREDLIKQMAFNTSTWLTTQLSGDYGYPIVDRPIMLITVSDKNFAETSAFNAAYQSLTNRMASLHPDSPPRAADMQDYIDYFASVNEKYTDTENKSEVRIRYAACYNLAVIYLLMEQPERATEWANKLIANGFRVST